MLEVDGTVVSKFKDVSQTGVNFLVLIIPRIVLLQTGRSLFMLK